MRPGFTPPMRLPTKPSHSTGQPPIPKKPPVIPQKPSTVSAPSLPPKVAPKRVKSLGSIGKIRPAVPITPQKPGMALPTPPKPDGGPPARPPPSSSPSQDRASIAKKGKGFKRKLFSTFRPGSATELPPSNTPPTQPQTRSAESATPKRNTYQPTTSITPRSKGPKPIVIPEFNGVIVSGPMDKNDEKRKNIVSEMVTTEIGYLKVLDTLIQHYQIPLLSMAETEELPTVSKREIRLIFSNIEQLAPINEMLMNEIRGRALSWHATQIIGDIFDKTGPFFKLYNMYGSNFDKGQEQLDKCFLDPSFTAQIEICAGKAKAQKLENLLIQPIQRIPRYNLLLRDLLAKTDENHPDHSHLTAALATLEGVMTYLDKNITDTENMQKMLKFSNVKGANALVQPHRQMMQEFTLNVREQDSSQVASSLKKKFKSKALFKESKLNIWLFNDVLVHLLSGKSKKKTNVASTKYTWPLELVWVKDIIEIEPNDTKYPYSFLLVGPRTTYTLRFPDPTDKKKWMKVFDEAISSCLSDENCPDVKKLCRYGMYEFPDKDRGSYKGWWKFGKIHGQGVYTFYDNCFTGNFEYNQKMGTGTMELSSGEVYHGEWKEDLPHGIGSVLYPNKDRYEGEWEEGVRSGHGVHFYANGDKYSGNWAHNVCNGEGNFTSLLGYEYQGGWKNSVFHGSGILTLPNGKQYEGEFRDGVRHGEGRMDYANGKFYVGQWISGKYQGKGILFCEVEGTYDGEFKEGFKEGQGTMRYSSGDLYVGAWRRNLFHGTGKFTCASGGMVSYEGQWESQMKHGKGVLIYRNEGKYEGHFRDDLQHGHGVYTSRAAVVSDGKWEEGRKNGKLSISVGQSKFSAQCNNALMDEGKIHSFFVFPEPPTIHINL